MNTSLDFWKDLAAIVFPSFAGGAFVVFLAKNWFLERLKGSIKSEYDERLERLKAELSSKNSQNLEIAKTALLREAEVIAAANKAFIEAHNTVYPHKVEAIKGLWQALLYVQKNSPPAFTIIEVIPEDALNDVFSDHGLMLKAFPDITSEDLGNMTSGLTSTAQNNRLFAGEYLWSLFLAYQMISLRIAFMFVHGKLGNKILPWYKDNGCLSVVESVCTATEFSQFKRLEFGHIRWIRQLIEAKFLSASDKILNGSGSANMALEEAQRIRSAVAALDNKHSVVVPIS